MQHDFKVAAARGQDEAVGAHFGAIDANFYGNVRGEAVVEEPVKGVRKVNYFEGLDIIRQRSTLHGHL